MEGFRLFSGFGGKAAEKRHFEDISRVGILADVAAN